MPSPISALPCPLPSHAPLPLSITPDLLLGSPEHPITIACLTLVGLVFFASNFLSLQVPSLFSPQPQPLHHIPSHTAQHAPRFCHPSPVNSSYPSDGFHSLQLNLLHFTSNKGTLVTASSPSTVLHSDSRSVDKEKETHYNTSELRSVSITATTPHLRNRLSQPIHLPPPLINTIIAVWYDLKEISIRYRVPTRCSDENHRLETHF
ncbi:hypothetical protein VTL71DRAFT_11741 [Oculimacula yallundae]|uniref:Uncharacterized protein n=1 Tax=Oculimacula yallundae TaxID=86028 RepID=A0ABR4CSR7_9HELO